MLVRSSAPKLRKARPVGRPLTLPTGLGARGIGARTRSIQPRALSRLGGPTQKESETPRRPSVSCTPRLDTKIWSRTLLFLERLLLHYGIYRRYPLKPWPAFKNAWRIA